MKNYTQLKEENRFEIYAFKKTSMSLRKIAAEINKSPSTISRELKRNESKKGYRPQKAQEKALDRRRRAKKFRKMNEKLVEKIENMIKQDWSPEQISGVLAKDNTNISIERIYQHIWADKKSGGKLFMHLRHGHKIRKRKRGTKDNRGQIKNKVSIHERPEIVDQKSRIGDWEIDLVSGKNHKGFLVTMVERFSKFTFASYVEHKDSSSILRAVVKLLGPLKAVVHTITSDNGKEFADHKTIAEQLNASFYFADTYSAWQRGLNENTNGLIRQYFPKKSCFASIKQEQLDAMHKKLNDRPRKSLNFESPFKVFSYECKKLGIIC